MVHISMLNQIARDNLMRFAKAAGVGKQVDRQLRPFCRSRLRSKQDQRALPQFESHPVQLCLPLRIVYLLSNDIKSRCAIHIS